MYKELTENNTGPKDFDRFEEWILADGATYSDVQPTRQRDTQGMSLGSNITFDQGLKLGGLVKKVRQNVFVLVITVPDDAIRR